MATEARKAYNKSYYLKNRDKLLLKMRKFGTSWASNIKWEVLTHYSRESYPVCSDCNEQRLACLSIDHLNNDGAKERKRLKIFGGSPFYRWLRHNNYPEGYQVLCMNCQAVKEMERRKKK